MENYNTLKKSDLKSLCKERKIDGYSKKNKSGLVNDLHEWDALKIQKPNEPKKTTWVQ